MIPLLLVNVFRRKNIVLVLENFHSINGMNDSIKKIRICTLMFKIKNNPSPNYLADLFELPSRKGPIST